MHPNSTANYALLQGARQLLRAATKTSPSRGLALGGRHLLASQPRFASTSKLCAAPANHATATAAGTVSRPLRVLPQDVVKQILDELHSVDANSDGRYVSCHTPSHSCKEISGSQRGSQRCYFFQNRNRRTQDATP